jgi:hypothetical protein
MGKNPLIGGDSGRGRSAPSGGGSDRYVPFPPSGRDDIEAMIRFCHELNFTWKWVRQDDRWHYVIPAKTADESNRYAIATGTEGAECWMVYDTGRVSYEGKTSGDLAKAAALARFRVTHGVMGAPR